MKGIAFFLLIVIQINNAVADINCSKVNFSGRELNSRITLKSSGEYTKKTKNTGEGCFGQSIKYSIHYSRIKLEDNVRCIFSEITTRIITKYEDGQKTDLYGTDEKPRYFRVLSYKNNFFGTREIEMIDCEDIRCILIGNEIKYSSKVSIF